MPLLHRQAHTLLNAPLLRVAEPTANAAAAAALLPRQYTAYCPAQLAAVNRPSVYGIAWCTDAGLSTNSRTAAAAARSSCSNTDPSLGSESGKVSTVTVNKSSRGCASNCVGRWLSKKQETATWEPRIPKYSNVWCARAGLSPPPLKGCHGTQGAQQPSTHNTPHRASSSVEARNSTQLSSRAAPPKPQDGGIMPLIRRARTNTAAVVIVAQLQWQEQRAGNAAVVASCACMCVHKLLFACTSAYLASPEKRPDTVHIHIHTQRCAGKTAHPTQLQDVLRGHRAMQQRAAASCPGWVAALVRRLPLQQPPAKCYHCILRQRVAQTCHSRAAATWRPVRQLGRLRAHTPPTQPGGACAA